MIVKVKYDDNTDRGVVGWLHRLPKDRQYVDMRTKDMSKYGGPKDVPAFVKAFETPAQAHLFLVLQYQGEWR